MENLPEDELADEEFLAAFHSCRLPASAFRNTDHFRLAWLHLHREPFDEALRNVREGILKFAAHHGVAGKYHETITGAWVHLLATHAEKTFEEFLTVNESRLSLQLLHRFWSPELLASGKARSAWVPPDRRPLPLP